MALRTQIRFDRQITIRRATETQSSTGHPTKIWADVFTTYAQVDFGGQSGQSEKYEANREISVSRTNFTVRYGDSTNAVTVKDRVSYDGNEYDIEGINEPKGRRKYLKYYCKLRV